MTPEVVSTWLAASSTTIRRPATTNASLAGRLSVMAGLLMDCKQAMLIQWRRRRVPRRPSRQIVLRFDSGLGLVTVVVSLIRGSCLGNHLRHAGRIHERRDFVLVIRVVPQTRILGWSDRSAASSRSRPGADTSAAADHREAEQGESVRARGPIVTMTTAVARGKRESEELPIPRTSTNVRC